MNIKQTDNRFIAHTYGRFDLALVKGKGSLVWDENGNEYIDLATGIAVNTFGYADDAWAQAVANQASTLQHTSNLYYSEPCAKLAQMLCERTGMKKVFFSNSGAEANECAIKVARKYACEKKGKEYNTIVTLINSFHGRTLTTLAATGQEVFHKDFTPLTPGFVSVPANDLEAVEEAFKTEKPAGILMEIVQGEGGVLPLEESFVKGVAKLCEEYDVVLMCDEVQCGNGRSGELYAYMNYAIQPDVVSTAKGLAGGLPLGATMLGEKVQDVLTPGSHGSTFGGNPVCAAAAVSVLERIDEALLKEVKEKSTLIFDTLNGQPGIISVDGMGLMIGIKTERDASEVIKDCMANGVLPIKAKDKVRLLPALNIPTEQLKKALEVLKKAAVKEN
ncbi:MAG TPA: aspartate aminotransferase family protein [Ruminococcaceae bacterium]|nr:aspartate aminotransferase family protein [Oscillospiraceae bacterium]